MTTINRISALAALAAITIVVGCDPYDRYCSKIESCNDEDEEGYDFVYGSDYHAVCVQELKGTERVLRANEEPECQVAADAYKAQVGCAAGIEDCQDLRKADLGGECETEREALEDANKDAEDECQTAVAPSCGAGAGSASPAALAMALAALALRRARARTRRAA